MKNNKLVECPNCLGAKNIMVPNETRGFHYENCGLCKATGAVDPQLADDYVFSLDETVEIDNTNDDY